MRVRFVQQTQGCSDFDVTLDGDETPSFRMLLPEHVTADGHEPVDATHVILGEWAARAELVEGRFALADMLEIHVKIEPAGSAAAVALNFENTSGQTLRNITANVCTSVNHLPGEPGWSNRDFIPEDVPLDRNEQGRAWYERVTPGELCALTEGGWVGMHPHPDDPDASNVPLYGFVPSEKADARACAVESESGLTFLQAWDVPCHHCTPCPGNACMHLVPVVAETLAAGKSAEINATIGIHDGGRQSLASDIGW
jgi:hypothetical protein